MFGNYNLIKDGPIFNPIFLLMFQHRFANATQVNATHCQGKSNWYKLENMKNAPNNTHTPYSHYQLNGVESKLILMNKQLRLTKFPLFGRVECSLKPTGI